MAGRYADFDAAIGEHRREPVVVRLFGEDWELPADPPGMVWIMAWRARFGAEAEDGDRDVTQAESETIVRDLVPQEILEEWFRRGLHPVTFAEQLLPELVRLYTRRDPDSSDEDGDAEGEAEATGSDGPVASSKTGRSSKPTLPANTGSRTSSDGPGATRGVA